MNEFMHPFSQGAFLLLKKERRIKMNIGFKRSGALLIAVLMLFAFTSCGATEDNSVSLWDSAVYTEDAEFGEGAKLLGIKVTAEEKSIVFSIHSDAETVGAALLENELVKGTDGQYGLYISHVNGMKAVYEEDGTYWGFYNRDGEIMSTGVDMTEFADGDVYELRYTK